jgi:site-specific DNA recombinase
MTAVSQREREAIGERTWDALNHKRRQRERVGNKYGCRLAADGVHEPDKAEQSAVTRIHQLRASKHTLREVAADLNEQGFRTRRGSRWRHEYVARAIRCQDSLRVGIEEDSNPVHQFA